MFLLNSKNIITILLYSEAMWVVLYSYTTVAGIINDELILTSTSFLLLALAGLEFCIGFLVVIFFKNFKKSFNLDYTINTNSYRNITYNKYVWDL